jgi:hypothetical protein
MATNYVLVDFENLQPDMSGLAGTAHKVLVFFGAKQQSSRHHFGKFDALFELGANLQRIKVSQSGKNALDMHIAFEIGRIFEREQDAVVHVISADTDFDPLLETLRKQGFACSRAKDVGALGKKRPSPAVPAMGAVPKKAKNAAASAPRKPATPAMNVDAIVKQLSSMSGKPSTRKKLAQTIASYFKHHGGEQPEKVVEQAIDELIRRKVVTQNAGKVNYQLG